MATLNDITRVDISLNTLAVQRANFGTPLVAALMLGFTDRVRSYSSFTAAQEDNLPPLVLTAVGDCFAQTPSPTTVKVGRRQALNGDIEATDLIALADYTVTVGTTDYTFTAGGTAPTAAAVAAGIKAEIDGDVGATVTATVTGDTLTLAPTDPADFEPITLGDYLEWTGFEQMGAATAVADDFAAIVDADNAWYAGILVERDLQQVEDAAEWFETQKKLFVLSSDQADILNQSLDTDLFSTLKASRYFRTAGVYHVQAATEFVDAAWVGKMLTTDPGSQTWALKSMQSITANNLTGTQRNSIYGKSGNTFEFLDGQNIALIGVGVGGNGGKTFGGEWIDVIRGRDWLEDLIQTNMVQMIINRGKVPYTDPGIQLCVNNLRGSLRTGQTQGFIAPDEVDANGNTVPGFVITYPLASEVDSVTKASRVLNIGFTARLAGAIHLVNITGNLAYEL